MIEKSTICPTCSRLKRGLCYGEKDQTACPSYQPLNSAAGIRDGAVPRFFQPTKKELTIIEDHIIQADALKVMKLLYRMSEEVPQCSS